MILGLDPKEIDMLSSLLPIVIKEIDEDGSITIGNELLYFNLNQIEVLKSLNDSVNNDLENI